MAPFEDLPASSLNCTSDMECVETSDGGLPRCAPEGWGLNSGGHCVAALPVITCPAYPAWVVVGCIGDTVTLTSIPPSDGGKTLACKNCQTFETPDTRTGCYACE